MHYLEECESPVASVKKPFRPEFSLGLHNVVTRVARSVLRKIRLINLNSEVRFDIQIKMSLTLVYRDMITLLFCTIIENM